MECAAYDCSWPVSDCRRSTLSRRLSLAEADVRRIRLPGERGEQRESVEQPGTTHY